jgi:hypothetical protein
MKPFKDSMGNSEKGTTCAIDLNWMLEHEFGTERAESQPAKTPSDFLADYLRHTYNELNGKTERNVTALKALINHISRKSIIHAHIAGPYLKEKLKRTNTNAVLGFTPSLRVPLKYFPNLQHRTNASSNNVTASFSIFTWKQDNDGLLTTDETRSKSFPCYGFQSAQHAALQAIESILVYNTNTKTIIYTPFKHCRTHQRKHLEKRATPCKTAVRRDPQKNRNPHQSRPQNRVSPF